MTLPASPSWSELAPSRHPFDDGVAVRGALVRHLAGGAGQDLRALELGVDRLFVEAYGDWASWWRYAASEPGGGGPVQKWCCTTHSFFRGGFDPARVEAQADACLAALRDLREWLVILEDTYAPPLVGTGDDAVLELAVRLASIVTLVAERTGADDAWYRHAEQACTWQLEVVGVAPGRAREAVEAVFSGRFESWVGPPDDVRDDGATAIARLVFDRP